MGKTSSFIAAASLGIGLFAGIAGNAAGQSNPVDQVSNPTALVYPDVEISPRDMNPPFIRDGVVADPQRFARVAAGMAQSEVRSMLGEPLRVRGMEWDYNFQLKMPESQNYLVCQYKVVFTEDQRVRSTVWRRRQCQQLAGGDPVTQ